VVVSVFLDVVVLLLSWGIVWQQIAATRDHFVSDKMATPAKLLAALVICSTIVFSVVLFLAEAPPGAALLGIVLELASLWIFRGALRASREARLLFAFDPGLPHGLIDSGPYRYVRHPFYTSYLLFWFGWAIAIWSWWTLPFLIGFVGFYVGAATGEERKFASTNLGPEYDSYRQRAGLFWPKLPVRRPVRTSSTPGQG
jgi:protein-S-isoprenylcysteine O-methyltransferase Ste14